jgi:hypothetical protein
VRDPEEGGLRIGDWEIRPLGGGPGCLMMILFSALASIILTVLLNVVLYLLR